MNVTNVGDFWTAVHEQKPLIEVRDPSLIRKILWKHFSFRLLGLSFFLSALCSAVLIPLVVFRYIPSVLDIWFFEEFMDFLELLDFDFELEDPENLIFMRNFIKCYLIVFLQGLLARFFFVRSINGQYRLRQDPVTLVVSHSLSPYTSRFLGVRFSPTVSSVCPECGQEGLTEQGGIIRCPHCRWADWKRNLR
ncbi:hypothetical protein H1S01_11770 [Heliobacterium chlorum]|uniref:Uncharacterized protein n=1 Tax=Heliobacterium chlorum TaxID=2698 RepID=A0ABR7T4P1_HELCL|nr:hypothetical protein [Heliobacterium chlorum]MBC9785187.1 hypothetical protein [Heliobacterium chlorum]